MNSDQWRRVESLYHAALERELDARPSFLKETCSDEQVRLEVAALLKYDTQAKSFIETPALRGAARALAAEVELEPDSVAPREIGPYRLLAPIGEGGMGEVHLALDSRLNRKVAIKLLPSAFTADVERAQRFKQEARASSALSHPNIVTVFEIGEIEGRHYIVSEYVEGETLRQMISSGQTKELDLRTALGIASQVARALEAAHTLGIIHRDIKPENVIVRKDGLVKVVDFGLAKLNSQDSSETNSQSQVLLTRSGVVMGTAAYMSPEQARGQQIDHRADIFSFGAMTYELLSGERPFSGSTTSDVIAAVLIKDPEPISKIAPRVTPTVAAIVHRCLEKQPEKRFQSASDLAFSLQDLGSLSARRPGFAAKLAPSATIDLASSVWQRVRQPNKHWITAAVAGVLLVGLITLAIAKLLGSSSERLPVAFSFSLPDGWGLRRFDVPAVSPDGRMIVVSGFPMNDRIGNESALWLRRVESADANILAGTEGGVAPFWSPDNRYVAFFQQDKLKRVDVSNGVVSTIFDSGSVINSAGGPDGPITSFGASGPSAGTWGSADVILVSTGSKLIGFSAKGGAPTILGFFDGTETGQFNPRFLPDGKQFLYYSRNKDQQNNGIYLAALEGGAQRKLVVKNATAAIYVSPGYLLFSRDGQVFAQRFYLSRLELTGDPADLAAKLGNSSSVGRLAAFSASDNGTLVWRPDVGETPSINTTQLTWFDRSGKRLGSIGGAADYSGPAFSPDERHLVVAEVDPKTRSRDLWVVDVSSGARSRFMSEPVDELNPIWSPDGKWIYFTAEKNGKRSIYRKLANGTGIAEPLTEINYEANLEDISPDGRFLLFNSRRERQENPDLTILSLDANHRLITFSATQFREDHGQFSPNGHWMVYRSEESGKSAIYVRGLMSNGAPSTAKWQISDNGGDQPRWGADGRELFFLEDNKLMVLDIDTTGSSIASSKPRPLFKLNLEGTPRRNRYLISRDGQKILALSLAEAVTGSNIAAQLNWPATLKR